MIHLAVMEIISFVFRYNMDELMVLEEAAVTRLLAFGNDDATLTRYLEQLTEAKKKTKTVRGFFRFTK